MTNPTPSPLVTRLKKIAKLLHTECMGTGSIDNHIIDDAEALCLEAADALLALSHAQETLEQENRELGAEMLKSRSDRERESDEKWAGAELLVAIRDEQLAAQIALLQTLRAYVQHKDGCRYLHCGKCGGSDVPSVHNAIWKHEFQQQPCTCKLADVLALLDPASAVIPETPEKPLRPSGAEHPKPEEARSASPRPPDSFNRVTAND